MNHKISVRRQNLIQKFKKKSHHHLIILISDLSLFFQKLFLTSAKYLCFLFPFFLEIFRQTKNFMKERSSSENWKKKRRRKLKEKKKKKLYQSVYWCHSMQWIQFLETHLCINNRKKHFFSLLWTQLLRTFSVCIFSEKTREKNWKKKEETKKFRLLL